jgi:hypothetical protein
MHVWVVGSSFIFHFTTNQLRYSIPRNGWSPKARNDRHLRIMMYSRPTNGWSPWRRNIRSQPPRNNSRSRPPRNGLNRCCYPRNRYCHPPTRIIIMANMRNNISMTKRRRNMMMRKWMMRKRRMVRRCALYRVGN